MDPHCIFGTEPYEIAIVDAAETDAIVVDRSRISEREDLKATRVRQDRAVPRHEAMEATQLCDEIFAGLEMKVIGVAQQDLRADRLQLVRIDTFDCAERADRHKDRSLDCAMGGHERRCPRLAIRCLDAEVPGRAHRITIASPNE